MKTIFFSFAYDDAVAQEVFSITESKLKHLGYEVLSSINVDMEKHVSHSSIELMKRASVVIAFVAERSSNVLFEIGYAYGMGKQVVLVSNMTQLPFDLRTVSAIDSRLSFSEIAFEIVRQISRLESGAAQWHMALPSSLNEILEASITRPELFELVNREDFERAIVQEFRDKGFEVDFPEGAHEFGFDMRVKDRSEKSILVEVKKLNQNSKVSIASVQRLLGAAYAHDSIHALLICTSDFTNSARQFALRKPLSITLWSLSDLRQFSEQESNSQEIESIVRAKL